MNNRVHTGDALTVLRRLKAESVDCCVTSPPYWGLRDYGTAKWEGGAKGCPHKPVRQPRTERAQGLLHSTGYVDVQEPVYRDVCRKCGARRVDAQLGLERTPEEYVLRMVEIFREVRRVLKPEGTLWLNLGDSYATGAGKVGNCPGGGKQGERWSGGRGMNTKNPKWPAALGPIAQPNRMPIVGLKPKDLVGIPWRVAFALQADGWYLRSDIIWHKPNPMPESVRDRPTKAHEYLFLLSKSARYFYNADAIREPVNSESIARYHRARSATHKYADGGPGNQTIAKTFEHMRRKSMRSSDLTTFGLTRGTGNPSCSHPNGKNRRTVWTIPTRPFKGAHFATFPEKLIEPCILAGSPERGTVLDPFFGAGTTGLVATKLNRRYVAIELNPEYVRMAEQRIAGSTTERKAA